MKKIIFVLLLVGVCGIAGAEGGRLTYEQIGRELGLLSEDTLMLLKGRIDAYNNEITTCKNKVEDLEQMNMLRSTWSDRAVQYIMKLENKIRLYEPNFVPE